MAVSIESSETNYCSTYPILCPEKKTDLTLGTIFNSNALVFLSAAITLALITGASGFVSDGLWHLGARLPYPRFGRVSRFLMDQTGHIASSENYRAAIGFSQMLGYGAIGFFGIGVFFKGIENLVASVRSR